MPTTTLKKTQNQNRRYFERLDRHLSLEMVLIPSGAFTMGSPEHELERQESESPQHEVALSSLFMGRYPITQAQWRFVASLPEVKRPLKFDPAYFKGDMRPVEQISWYDSVEFCDRLSIYTDRSYRLPTEAEWEYACRAGTTTPFYCGETISTDIANYDGHKAYGNGQMGEYRKHTTPADEFSYANPWGICDMHGNVLEWCLDHWHDNYEAAPTDGRAWLSGDEDADRILRGGSWGDDPRWCRSASRDRFNPGIVYFSIGFRVVSALRGIP